MHVVTSPDSSVRLWQLAERALPRPVTRGIFLGATTLDGTPVEINHPLLRVGEPGPIINAAGELLVLNAER